MYDEDEEGGVDDDDLIDGGQCLQPQGRKEYCHYNSSTDESFNIDLFDQQFTMLQKPNAASELGIGAVVWDSSVIFSKYVEYSRNGMFATTKMIGKSVLELG